GGLCGRRLRGNQLAGAARLGREAGRGSRPPASQCGQRGTICQPRAQVPVRSDPRSLRGWSSGSRETTVSKHDFVPEEFATRRSRVREAISGLADPPPLCGFPIAESIRSLLASFDPSRLAAFIVIAEPLPKR